ncbi:MAG: DUF3307 domain-containing protein [Gammaproteobacteria bacterium]|nr:DUF3307 domain-containing protein [Pseudomonadales bacterium]MCP5346630.1 DUF3307 domain-containing protein [Pseudomonadales bacterium]
MPFLETLFMLMVGHALADFVLQPEVMGYGKNRNSDIHNNQSSRFPHWAYWMTGHSLIHGGIVFLITGNILLGLIETVSHWCIDFMKCEGRLTLHQDQALHVALKVAYAALA